MAVCKVQIALNCDSRGPKSVLGTISRCADEVDTECEVCDCHQQRFKHSNVAHICMITLLGEKCRARTWVSIFVCVEVLCYLRAIIYHNAFHDRGAYVRMHPMPVTQILLCLLPHPGTSQQDLLRCLAEDLVAGFSV